MRAVICPDKITTAQWLEVHATAHAVGLRSNNTIMFGHVDGPRNWARHLLAVRSLAARDGRLHGVRPAPVRPHGGADVPQGPRAARGRRSARRCSCTRLAGSHSTRGSTNIQVSWVKAGPHGVVEALHAGVNDLGGTLMNESISRAAGAEWGQELSPGADGGS